MKILLINPDNPAEAGRDLYAGDIYSALGRFKGSERMYFGLPLALPTLAAVTPSQHSVKIVDEMVDTIDFNGDWDLVGITAMTFKAPRAYEIAAEFKKRGVPVIMGGIHASVRPKEAIQYVDSVVVGEADALWPKILEDFERGQLKREYYTEQAPDISNTPPPRHDLSAHDKYFMFFLQTTRGCPFSCNFCTVTRFNGKTIRKKSPEQVVQEVESVLATRKKALRVTDESNGKKTKVAVPIFFTDDNFAIDRKHAIAVCVALTKFQKENGIRLSWFTQVNFKVGLDNDLLSFLREAGCRQLFMGFESLGAASLKAMRKTMNKPEKYAAAIKNVKRYGIEPIFSTIIGSEYDDLASGDALAEFIENNEVFYVLPNIMTPYPGTVLGDEMEKKGRIYTNNPGNYNVRNVVFQPKLMTPFQLQALYTAFCSRLFRFDNMIKRATASINQPQRYRFPILTRLLVWPLFSFSAILLVLRGKLRFRVLVKLLLVAPRFIVLNGSLSALGLLATSADYDDFARSEKERLPKSPAAFAPETETKLSRTTPT